VFIFFFLNAKSKDLAMPTDTYRSMKIGLDALFAIANVELNLKVASRKYTSLPSSIVESLRCKL